jgi:amino acid transporter
MSDIGLNLDGVIAFLAAAVLAALLALSIVIVSCIAVISARRHHRSITRQGLFSQVVGMCASFLACLFILITILLSERLPPPRAINIWLDHWFWAWLLIVLALWPAAAYMWKRARR